MSNQKYDELCGSITPLLVQKRSLAYYNIPQPRLNIDSPYPQYSPFQLNMRRKAEILKYTSSQQNTKTNNPTKKQKFASLVKGSNRFSQNQVNQPYSNLVCNSDLIKPTLSTSCNVPGPPIILNYDPDVPLYNYGNYKENRTYAIANTLSNAAYNAYNINIIEFIASVSYTFDADIEMEDDVSDFTYTDNLGVLIIGNNLKDNTYSFSISSPVAVWFSGVRFNNNSTTLSIKIKIKSITAYIYYNDVLITSKQSEWVSPIIVSCLIDSIRMDANNSGVFHAIQYVGMMNINNLILQTPPQTIYNIKYEATYTYNSYTVNDYLVITSGVFANLPSENDLNYINNCSLNYDTPSTFRSSSFLQFIV